MTEQLRHIVSLCGNTECVTFWKSDMIVVYEKNKVIIHLEPTEYCVTSAVYKNGILYYSVKDSNVIYRIDASKQILDPLSLYDYKEPRFLAAVNYYDSAFVIADGTGRTAVYDITSKQELHVLPVEAGQFRDFEMVNTSESIMLCHKWRSVARYADDDDDETTIMMSFQVSNAAPVVQKRDSLRIYTFTDNWDDRQKSWVRNDIAMRLPIFDCYLYYWPVDKSLSMCGKYVVYYCEDIKGLIISSYIDGTVYRILELPEKFTKEDGYYFNETTNSLTIVQGMIIHRFAMNAPDPAIIDNLNTTYNNFEKKKASARNDHAFQKVLFRAIDACSIISTENAQKAKKKTPSVFVSYSTANYQYAKDLVDYLEQSSISCWLAPKDIAGGDVFTKEISTAICNCDVVLLILSKASAESTWVAKEITFAIENKKTIIPVQIEEIAPSSHIGLCLSGINRVIAFDGVDKAKETIRNSIIKMFVKSD